MLKRCAIGAACYIAFLILVDRISLIFPPCFSYYIRPYQSHYESTEVYYCTTRDSLIVAAWKTLNSLPPEWLTAIATVTVACFTATLWLSTHRLWKATLRSARIAEQTLTDLERPYVFIYEPYFLPGSGPGSISQFVYTVSNQGRIAAIIEEVEIGCGFEINKKFPPLREIGDHPFYQNPIITSDQPRVGTRYIIDKMHLEWQPPNYILRDQFIMRIVIKYRGPFSKDHETSQCWCFQERPFGGLSWVEIADSRYTYMR
jgi:hypothetical protein